MTRGCLFKKFGLLITVVLLGNIIVIFGFHQHGLSWGVSVGIIAGLSTWLVPYEPRPDLRPHDKGLKIKYIDMNIHPDSGDSSGQQSKHEGV